jgi:phage-related protein
MYNNFMVEQWDVEFYSDHDGNCEVAEWIMKLKVSQRDKVIAWIDKLQEMGPLLPRPYADLLLDGIHELRMKVSGNQVRILYFFVFENRIVLTHPFYKHVSKVPEKEINKAIQIREDYLRRN